MAMRKLSVFILFLFFSLGASAQLDFGLRAGVGLAGASIDEFEGGTNFESLESTERPLTYHGGIYAKVSLAMLFIQPEVLITNINQTLQAKSSNNPDLPINLSFNRLDVPLLVGTKLGPIRAVVGPVFSMNLSEVSDNLGDNLNSGGFGYQAGIGLELGSLQLDLRYESSFSSWASAVIINNTAYNADLRSNQLMLCLAFDLL